MGKYKRTESVANRLREAMRNTGKTQADLARETGISKATLSRYLSGQFEPKQIAVNKLAVSLNVAEMWLWGCDVPMERPTEYKKEKPTVNDDELSEAKRKLIEKIKKLPEDQVLLLLQVAERIG